MLVLNRIHNVVPSFARMHREMNDLFNAFASSVPTAPVSGSAMNVWEDAHHYFVESELPGFRMEDVEVSVLADELTIKGERRAPDRESATWLRRERPTVASFARSFTLPNAVQADKVEASLTNGVLLVTLPKTPALQPRKITVKRGS